jgi:hypothetical protein
MPLIQHYSLAQDDYRGGVKNTEDIVFINGKPVNRFSTDTSGNPVGPSDREPYGRYTNAKDEVVILEPGEQEFLETERQARKKDSALPESERCKEIESRFGTLTLKPWRREVISDQELATRENFRNALKTHFPVEEPFRGDWMITPSKK